MGTQCMRPQSSNLRQPKTVQPAVIPQPKILAPNRSPSICIKVQAKPPSKNNQGSQPSQLNTQKLITYSQKLEDNFNLVKFAENVGFFHDSLKNISFKDQIVFEIQKTENKNYLVSLQGIANKELWKMIPSEGMWFDQRDEILIGRTLLKLKYWLTSDQTLKMKNKTQVKMSICKDEKAQCRICLEPAIDSDNPLVEPCKCTGSVSAIHQKCLSKWIFSNRDSFSQKMCFYKVRVKNWQCQICGSSFRNYIWYRLMSITTYFPGHYAIFQIRNQKQQVTQDDPTFAVCKFTDQQPTMTIGSIQNAEFPLSNAGKQQIKIKLTKTESGLYLLNQSKQCSPYLLTETKYLRYNEEYKLRNMYLMLMK